MDPQRNPVTPWKMAWFPAKQGGAGAAGALVSGQGYVPSQAGTLLYLRVDDIGAALARITANDGPTLLSRTGIGEHGFIAPFEECEGSRVALHSTR
jgi:predicted enzyme related to lactoylglutathione lyase